MRWLLLAVALGAGGCALTDSFGSGARKKQLLAEARSQLARNDVAAAVASLSQAREIDPKDPVVLVRLGQAQVALGHDDAAYLPLKEASELPGGEGALWALGRVLRRRKAYAEAEAALKRALVVEKDRGPVLVELGVTYWLADRVPEAQSTLEQAVAEAPDSFPARFHLAELFRKKEDLPKAREQLAAALKAEPDNPYAHFSLAEVLFAQNELAQAAESYRRVVAANKPFPRLGRVFFQLAQIAMRSRDHRRALGHLELAAQRGYDAGLIAVAEARAALAMGNHARVEKALARVEAKAAELPQVYYLRGRLELARGHPAPAAKALEQAAARELDPGEVQAALGTAYVQLLDAGPVDEPRVDRALGALQKALKSRPHSREALLGLARLHARHRLDLQLAAAHLKTILESSKDGDAEASALLAAVLARLGQHKEALDQLERAGAAPVDPQREFLRGALLLAQNQPRAAEEAVVRGFSAGDRDLNGRLVLIAVYSRTGRADRARELLLRLLEPTSDSEIDASEEPTYAAIAAVLGPARPPDPFRSPSARLERRTAVVAAEIAKATPPQALELLRGLVGELVVGEILEQLSVEDANKHRAAIARLIGAR